MSASEHRLYFLLQLVAHRMKKKADGVLVETAGITTAQSAVMGIIVKDGPVSQREIARTLSQNESAVTAMSKRLLKAGYIKRTRSSTDARAWELTATRSGSESLSNMRQAFKGVNDVLDGTMTPDEIAALAGNLKDILTKLDAEQYL